MKCLMRYGWVKLMRSHLPEGKGILGMWAKLASRAAFRKGHATYCGYKNELLGLRAFWECEAVGKPLKRLMHYQNSDILGTLLM